MSQTSVILIGAAGKMGKEAVKAIQHSEQYDLHSALTRQSHLGEDAGLVAGIAALQKPLTNNLTEVLSQVSDPALAVDLSLGESAYHNALALLKQKIPVVIGATGQSKAQLEELSQLAKTQKTGVLLVPNFSIGAILMMQFAKMASQYFDYAEIIELHHDKKKDAPSGTALKTADMMGDRFDKNEKDLSRGLCHRGTPIHSVRLPGLLAHQEVIFGGQGQTLKLRHDSLDRSSFMPGLLMAMDAVQKLESMVIGLEHFLTLKQG